MLKSRILIVFVSTFIISVNLFSQDSTRLSGFWGIPFGSSIISAKKALLSKEGATLNVKNTKGDILIVDGAKFGGRKTSYISLIFINDKFHTAHIYFQSALEAKVIELYDHIKSDLQDKYGAPQDDFKNFKYPYEEGDGHEITAIKLGKADYSSYWSFPRPDEGVNTIALEINNNLFVELCYQDSKLIKEYLDKKKAKDAKDY